MFAVGFGQRLGVHDWCTAFDHAHWLRGGPFNPSPFCLHDEGTKPPRTRTAMPFSMAVASCWVHCATPCAMSAPSGPSDIVWQSTKGTTATCTARVVPNFGHECSVGVPSSLKMVFIWSISPVPCTSGSPCCSHSAKMHPNDQMSTAYPYAFSPRRISGARYQREVTFGVQGLPKPEQRRASPKSHSLRTPFLSSSKFVCFRSLRADGTCRARSASTCCGDT